VTAPESTQAAWSTALLAACSDLDAAAAGGIELDASQRADLDALLHAVNEAVAVAMAADSPLSAHDIANSLNAVKGYSELLQEDLAADSPLILPLTRVLAVAGQTDSASPAPAGHKPVPITRSPGRILVVDDLAANRELAARYLEQGGHQVIAADGGEQALQILASEAVDIVLLDLLMPGMHGREVLAAIKSHELWRALPVIVISGSQDMNGIIACIEAGADDYLFKPFNPVLLQARITAGLERKRWHDRELQYQRQLERNERFIRATFGRYLSDDIVADILERPEGLELGGRLRTVTILMSDICGFTELSQQHPPDAVVRLLNSYLGRMTDIIMQHGGTIDEFIGDAILAAFGAPREFPDAADRAVRCALAMQDAMADINHSNTAAGLPTIGMGIALNTGPVIAGNIGSERRSKYGFVGHPVNVTARIEDFSGPGDILISESTRGVLKGKYELGDERREQVKGIVEPLSIFPVLSEWS